jgi:disulfide bond formation protein DsbB
MTVGSSSRAGLAARLDDLARLVMLTALAAILTAAMILQYGYGEVPCPLCLLQRIAIFGICFALMLHFRRGDRVRCIGIGMVSALFLLVASARQTLLDICPLPGRSYVGSAVLGLHMPVWSVLVALAVIAAFAVQLAALGGGESREEASSPLLARIAAITGLYVIALCAINLVSAILQCGLGACHTTGYELL